MNFVEELLEDGGRFIAERHGAEVTFRAASHQRSDLESFQAVVQRLRQHEGCAYRILRNHIFPDHRSELIDSVTVSMAKH